MIEISENLRKTAVSVLDTASLVNAFLNENKELNRDKVQQVSYCCAELALLSLAAYNEIDDGGSPTDRMIKHELASAFKQIAMHSLNIQEWEKPDNIRACFSTIFKHCKFISASLKIPLPEKESGITAEKLSLIPVLQRLDAEDMGMAVVPAVGESTTDKIKIEIQALREILIALVLERDHLINVVCKAIEADYMEALGSLEAELYRAECEVRYLKRLMEMMQAAINRREKPDENNIEQKLKEQYEDYKRVYEQFKKHINAAAEYKSAQKKKAEADNKSPEEAESEAQRIKKLYRKIVKAMHPDLHPDQSEEEKALFRKAIEAYESGDLKTLTEIAAAIDGKSLEARENELDKLLGEKAHILKLIKNIKAEIRIIKASYPYSKKDLLDNPQKLAQEKERLENRLEQALRQAEIYRERIRELKTWEN